MDSNTNTEDVACKIEELTDSIKQVFTDSRTRPDNTDNNIVGALNRIAEALLEIAQAVDNYPK